MIDARLWSWKGVVGRRDYLLAGVLLFAVKYPLDWFVAHLFDHAWNPLMYLSPRVSPLLLLDREPWYWFSLLAVAMPFIVVGVALTTRRLRDAGIPVFWTGLFFLPFLNFAFFLFLAAVPSDEHPADLPPPLPEKNPYRLSDVRADYPRPFEPFVRAIPQGVAMAFLAGVAASVLIGFATIAVAHTEATLGVSLFIGAPFAMGFVAAFVSTVRRPDATYKRAVSATFVALGCVLVALLAFSVEGVACIFMATPLLMPIACVGAYAGYTCTKPRAGWGPLTKGIGAVAVPFALLFDAGGAPPPAELHAEAALTIAAPPDVVWKAMMTEHSLDAPPSSVFAIAPMPTAVGHRNAGMEPTLHFTIGTFAHTLAAVKENERVTFHVTAQPKNLDQYVTAHDSDVVLTANDDKTTTVHVTTSYALDVHPAEYWSRWTNAFVHASQMRILEGLKDAAEHPSDVRAHVPAPMPAWICDANATCNCTRHEAGTLGAEGF